MFGLLEKFLSEKMAKQMIAIIIGILLNIVLAVIEIDRIHPDGLLYVLLSTQLIALIFSIFLIQIFINGWNKSKPERIFKGQWEKRFKGPDKNGIKSTWSQPEVFVIQNGNQCWAYAHPGEPSHHRFDVSNFILCKRKKTLTFTLKYVIEPYTHNHPRENNLTIKDVTKMDYFEGVETGDETGEYTDVFYIKIKPKTRISEPLLIARCPNPNCSHIVPIHKIDVSETIHCAMCGMDFKYMDNQK